MVERATFNAEQNYAGARRRTCEIRDHNLPCKAAAYQLVLRMALVHRPESSTGPHRRSAAATLPPCDTPKLNVGPGSSGQPARIANAIEWMAIPSQRDTASQAIGAAQSRTMFSHTEHEHFYTTAQMNGLASRKTHLMSCTRA